MRTYVCYTRITIPPSLRISAGASPACLGGFCVARIQWLTLDKPHRT